MKVPTRVVLWGAMAAVMITWALTGAQAAPARESGARPESGRFQGRFDGAGAAFSFIYLKPLSRPISATKILTGLQAIGGLVPQRV
jgi:hypothetical protein